MKTKTNKDSRMTLLPSWLLKNRLWFIAFIIFVLAIVARLPFISHGIDQWDAVLYKDSLVDMKFYREAQWPLLLLFQKGLWLIFPNLSPQEVLSLTSVIFSAGVLTLLFLLVYRITKSIIAGIGMTILLFFIPLFGVYSVVGMQDMAQAFVLLAFIASIVQAFYTKQLVWLYVACVIAGLSLGIRLTLILTLPSLILAVILLRQYDLKIYLKILAFFGLGAFFGLVGSIFIAPLPNSSGADFFIGIYHMFNPTVLGFWKKAGGYTLMSGNNRTIFYWIPTLWLLVYVLTTRVKTRLSFTPIIALFAALISLSVAYGMSIALKSLDAYAPSYYIFLVQLVLICGLLVFEIIKFILRYRNSHYVKNMDSREKSSLTIALLILTFITFNYIFVAGSTRYLLILLAPTLLLIILLAGPIGRKSIVVVVSLLIFSHWACGYGQAQAYVATFNNLDTRSSVAEYMKIHDGRYYNFDVTGTVVTYIKSYGVGSRLYGKPKWCSSVDFNKTNYAIFYGESSAEITKECPKVMLKQVAKFQRAENIIEDSVGNIGFTIYRMQPLDLD